MQRYVSKSGKPYGATGFSLEPDAVVVRFKGGHRYRYTYASCGKVHVNAMKRLAVSGKGLSTYVARHQPHYAERF